jgi:hypothetical protein
VIAVPSGARPAVHDDAALVGYGLVKTDLVDPRDFGWLSLAGTVGPALGGGVGAALSSKEDPRPILAGLAAGPLLGIATGAMLVPRLRSSSSSGDSHAMWIPSRKVAGFSAHLGSASGNSHQITSADVLASAKPSPVMNSLHKRSQVTVRPIINRRHRRKSSGADVDLAKDR